MTALVVWTPYWGLSHCHSRWPPVISDDPHLLLFLAAEPQLGSREQAVGNQDIPVDAIIDELRLAVRADDGRELDIDRAAVIVRIDRSPGRLVALDDVAVAALTHLGDGRC